MFFVLSCFGCFLAGFWVFYVFGVVFCCLDRDSDRDLVFFCYRCRDPDGDPAPGSLYVKCLSFYLLLNVYRFIYRCHYRQCLLFYLTLLLPLSILLPLD